ncbi:MAG: asparagine synthase (glutamine-hydrolyzing) [Gemmataceae bacterium]|nr:asparagine synthase (glutamine-hydrolyzing) [Gemmataceae bacterium]
MCGIAGLINLTDRRPVPAGTLQAMAAAIIHRGPDEDGYFTRDGLGLASRRLSIVGLADGRQPIRNEDGNVNVVFNGELFDYPEARARLEARGHRFTTHCDTEVIPHTWEDHQEQMFDHLRGQFAIALWDERRQRLILARDRFGVCPLYWTRQQTAEGDWLLFGSEIKALLASGMVTPRADRRGINHAFTFFGMPGPLTCFEGINCLLPGRYLRIQLGETGKPAQVSQHTYWEMDFPDQGQEEPCDDVEKLVDHFQAVLLASIERRLRADVPVVSYLSGGVDSSTVVALAGHIRKQPIPTFTIQIADPKLDETTEAGQVSRHLGCSPVVVRFGAEEALNIYPRLIHAAEGPVLDTSCGALLMLAREVHQHGYKVALTGEGADEWLAGYPWFKINKALSYLDVIPGLPLSQMARWGYIRMLGMPARYREIAARAQAAVGGHNGYLDVYGMLSRTKWLFYSPEMHEAIGDHVPMEDLQFNVEKMRRWHPLNRALCVGGRVHLPGLLLNHKGDRVAMHNSVETRYPFLDEEVFGFLAKIQPNMKMSGFREKYVLRKLAERWLPKSVAWRRKAMFRAPFDSFHADKLPPFVDQLLSEESLRKTGYFDPKGIAHWRQAFRNMRSGSYGRTFVEMGLVGVVATQLWHHTFIDPTLADLPNRPSEIRGPLPTATSTARRSVTASPGT